LTDTGRWEQAVKAYATGMTGSPVENSGWFADMVGGRIDSATSICLRISARLLNDAGRRAISLMYC
jgi:hypothetical protein